MISQLEVLDTRFNPNISLLYKDLLIREGGNIRLNSREELSDNLNWFQYYQILDLFKADMKKYGFKEKNSQLEETI